VIEKLATALARDILFAIASTSCVVKAVMSITKGAMDKVVQRL
jgi:hypothetical protein